MARTRGPTRWPNTQEVPRPLTADLPSSSSSGEENYPGLGIPLRDYPQGFGQFYPMGAHSNCSGSESELLPVREVAMMNIMDRLTDKKDWHLKVFNEEIVDKWRKEAMEIPGSFFWGQAAITMEWQQSPLKQIMSAKAFDYCVKELRNKAREAEKTGIIPTLDASASVVKSDTIVGPDLHNAIRQAFDTLLTEQAGSPDWHPGSGDTVQDLVHPSMYPLVYGESKVLRDEVVGFEDTVNRWAGKGEVINLKEVEDTSGRPRNSIGIRASSNFVPPSFWSETYQWLPANVEFQEDGSVQFTSYINNLHPTKHLGIYRTIEKLVEKALPMWDQCLSTVQGNGKRYGAGRTYSRYTHIDDPDDENEGNWDPPSKEDVRDVEIDWSQVPSQYRSPYVGEVEDEERLLDRKWLALRHPVQREPEEFEEKNYAPKPSERLSEKFKSSGLQIIVKMASIELKQDRAEFPQGSWHVEGQMNERICATALFYVDEENIEPSSLSFRMQTSSNTSTEDEYQVGQDCYKWLEQIHGTDLGCDGPCLQNYGSVQTPQGRLLAFPNVFQHRVSPFGLVDREKPGHRRFIALWLVDPHTRIISTANVPPQQEDWWTKALFGGSKQEVLSKLPAEILQLIKEKGLLTDGEALEPAVGRLPSELMDMVRDQFESPVMSEARAKEHRDKLMESRTEFHEETEGWWQHQTYSFCEH